MPRLVSIMALAVLLAACRGPLANQPAVQEQAAATPAATSAHLMLPSGQELLIIGNTSVLRSPDGKTLAENRRLVRSPDPGGVCPADGFRGAQLHGDGFVLRSQLCSGWSFIDETMTFAPGGHGYVLTRFSATFTDRRTAAATGSPKVLSAEDFGLRRFEDLNPDDLYPLLP